jgi:hypothetical protein
MLFLSTMETTFHQVTIIQTDSTFNLTQYSTVTPSTSLTIISKLSNIDFGLLVGWVTVNSPHC